MSEHKDITLFAQTNFRNRQVAFGIKRDDRRRHMYVIGKTGMGKTTLIENMVIQDILNGEGLAFVDPHGDSVEKILNYIPAERINDVVYFNPADTDFPIAFNPLEAVDPKYKHLVGSGLMGVFTKIWAGVWSSRMEYILNNTILALLDSPGNTLLGIARMLVNKTYRKKIIDNVKDPVVKSFWVDEFANYNDKFRTEAIAPIQNKVGQFLSSAIIRNIVGQTKSTIDMREIMDSRKIFLINLSKGRIGEDNSALLGAMIITKLQLAAMSRVDVPEEERKDFYLYVDEFQNFATESFANILSEARKYRLNLIVAHQYIGQLVHDKNTIVRDAIFGNVGTMITFRVGADDAEFLEKEFEPTYMLNDLVNLTKFNIYLKLMINGVASTPFSAQTLAPISQPTGNEDKVIRVSRERYGTSRAAVEERIHRWLGSEYHSDAARAESGTVEEEGAQDGFRFQEQAKIEGKTGQPVAEPVAKPEQTSTSAPAPKPTPRHDQGPAEHKPEPKKDAPKVRAHDRPKREERKPKTETQNYSYRRMPAAKPLDKPAKKSSANPVWETVTKMDQDRLKDRAQRATKALESLSKTLENSLSKEGSYQPITEPIPEPMPPVSAPKPAAPPEPAKPKPAPHVVPERAEAVPAAPDEVEMEAPDPNPPHGNLQSHLTNIHQPEHPALKDAMKKVPKLTKVKPGDKIKL
jgi:hypothetical protein